MLNARELEQLRAKQPSSPELQPPDAPVMRLLASMDRRTRSRLMTEEHYQSGDMICREGDRGDAMYLIWSGRVAVFKGDAQPFTILGYRGPGETIGEMALLDGQPRSASVVALEPLRLLRIDRVSFQACLSRAPTVGMGLMASLSSRLRASDALRTVETRVEQQLEQQVTQLQTEKELLLDIQRVRQETSNLVIHDLRNPLAVLFGGVNMLAMVLPEEALSASRELLDMLCSSCERMQRLVDSLLDVSRLDTGAMPMQVIQADLRPLLQEAFRRVTVMSQTRQITMRARLPDDLPLVRMDAEKIDRVLANLVDNALHYTPPGGTITLAVEAPPDTIVISVTDSGPGIPPAERERIFERFAQVAGAHVAHGRRGFGLGLTFCKLAVEAHGGHIWVEAGPDGQGSQFVFTLPN